MTQYWYRFTLDEAEWNAVQEALSHGDAHLGQPVPEGPMEGFRLDLEAVAYLRAELDKAPTHKSERAFTIDELNERARTSRWPHVAKRRKSPETRTIYHWRTINLDDCAMITLETALALYVDHFEREHENGATESFSAHREGLKGIRAKLDVSRL
jgi:hypothetical protein